MGTKFYINAYVADASVYCVDCAHERYPGLIEGDDTADREGNEISAIFQWEDLTDLACDGCGHLIEDTL